MVLWKRVFSLQVRYSLSRAWYFLLWYPADSPIEMLMWSVGWLRARGKVKLISFCSPSLSRHSCFWLFDPFIYCQTQRISIRKGDVLYTNIYNILFFYQRHGDFLFQHELFVQQKEEDFFVQISHTAARISPSQILIREEMLRKEEKRIFIC